ncbi:hypothetical protein GWI33_011730 [Rhynchophorus ferrugineus]|uniref:Uncharacterized protein n=1 Tax=Rhynchophorus ferrugineus TaxID=354439 RepID=A0A834MIN6_RHYFE|nr:hypothetical protein GWI33_011730 [Rhynchophorus ferrugineus]
MSKTGRIGKRVKRSSSTSRSRLPSQPVLAFGWGDRLRVGDPLGSVVRFVAAKIRWSRCGSVRLERVSSAWNIQRCGSSSSRLPDRSSKHNAIESNLKFVPLLEPGAF